MYYESTQFVVRLGEAGHGLVWSGTVRQGESGVRHEKRLKIRLRPLRYLVTLLIPFAVEE